MRWRARILVSGVTMAVAAGVSCAAALADSPLPSAELVSVTDSGFTATWRTAAPSDTTVCFGTTRLALHCRREATGTRYHFAQVGGLRPGTRYFYTLRSGLLPQPPSETNPGTFTTLTPPPGRHLFDFAVVSDTHIGETCSGTAVTAIGHSVPPCFSNEHPPYAASMLRHAVDEINRMHIPLVIDSADVTSSNTYEQAAEAKQILDGLDGRYYIVRGNHDRPAQGSPDPRCGRQDDCLRTVFFPGHAPGRIYYSFDFGGYHFVVLDSNDRHGHGDLTSPAQNRFLLDDLATAKRAGEKTFVVFHEPVSEYADTYAVPPVVFGVAPWKGGEQFLQEMKRFPNVVGVINSHTHRNFVSYAPATGARLPYIENATTKEYPAGFAVFRVYAGGYERQFVRLDCGFCLRWAYTTRGEYLGLYPLYTLGPLSSRSFVHLYDCAFPTPLPSEPGNESLFSSEPTALGCPGG